MWTCDIYFHYILGRVYKAINRPSLPVYLQHIFKTLQIQKMHMAPQEATACQGTVAVQMCGPV